MEAPSALLAITIYHWIAHIKSQQCRALMFSLMLASARCWTNRLVADDLRCHGSHVVGLEQDYSKSIAKALELLQSCSKSWCDIPLTHWGRVTHICVSKLTIIGSDNGLSPDRRQAIIWTNAGILLIRPLGTNFNEILIEIPTFSFTKMRLKVSSAKRRPFCLGLNVLTHLP